MTTDDWRIIVPNYDHYPETFRHTIPFLLASIVYHADFLREVLAPDHPLFASQVFAGSFVNKLRGKATAGIAKSPVGMRATGVPQHLILAAEFAELRDDFNALKDSMTAQNSIDKQQIFDRVDGVPEALHEMLLKNFNIEGLVLFISM